VEPAADHGLQIADVRDRQCWRQAGRDRSGIREPCRDDTCTPVSDIQPAQNMTPEMGQSSIELAQFDATHVAALRTLCSLVIFFGEPASKPIQ